MVFIFLYLDVIMAKIKKNVQICEQMIIVALLSKIFNVFLDFSYDNIWIWKNEDHFSFVLFCKESESAIGTEKFQSLNFDFPIPLSPPDGP